MGNRAMVYFKNNTTNELSCGLYLHWNGGPESIYSFLNEFNRRKYGHSLGYDIMRFGQIVGEFMDNNGFTGLSLGMYPPPKNNSIDVLKAINCDNGVYIIGFDSEKHEYTVIKRIIDNRCLSKKDIKKEKNIALKHEYIIEIKEVFDELDKNKLPDYA